MRYKSIDDSGFVPVDPSVTVLVGQNEAGKTAFLEALNKAAPADNDEGFNPTEDFPRKDLTEYLRVHRKEPAEVVILAFELASAEGEAINKDLGTEVIKNRFTFEITYKYDGTKTITLNVDEGAYVKHLLKSKSVPQTLRPNVNSAKTIKALIDALEEAPSLNQGLRSLLQVLKSRYEEANWNRLLAWRIWRDHLSPKVPHFLYFDDYMLLPGKANLPTLKSKAVEDLTSEGKTAMALLHMAGVDLDELLERRAYEEIKARLEGLSNSITDRVLEYWRQNSDIIVEFDVREDPTDDPPYNSGPNLYVRIRNKRHRVSLPFSLRSKGFIWFFSFLIWFDAVRARADDPSKLILLLDEPGLSLHASAQADLLAYMDQLSEAHQVIYTTHSPFMVRSDRLTRVRVVEDRIPGGSQISDSVVGSDPKTLFPLQAALGYDIAQNLFVGTRNLLVEGPSDLIYIKAAGSLLEQEGRATLREDIVVVPVGGLDKVATFVALLGANELELAVLHDSGGSAQRIQDVVQRALLRQEHVLHYGMFRSGGTSDSAPADVEDLFTPEEYLRALNGTYEKELGGSFIKESDLPPGDRVVDRINRFLKSTKLQLRPSGGFNHYRVARHLVSADDWQPHKDTLVRFEEMFEEINGLFSS